MNDKTRSLSDLDAHIQNLTTMDRVDMVPVLAEAYELGQYLQWYEAHGLIAQTHPSAYHAKTHTYQVMLNTYEGAMNSSLSKREIRRLLVAAMFHDAGHSQTVLDDRHNIAAAVRHLKLAHQACDHHQRLKEEELAEVIDLIRGTSYPYNKKIMPTQEIKILRDADMMFPYGSDPDVRLALAMGLYLEKNCNYYYNTWNGHKSWDHMAELELWIEKQEGFMRTLSWHTAWGRLKAMRQNFPQCARVLTQQMRDLKGCGYTF